MVAFCKTPLGRLCSSSNQQPLRNTLTEKYGSQVEQFFKEDNERPSWARAITRTLQPPEDDDDWFDEEDDIADMVSKGIVDSSFLQFLAGKVDEDDKNLVASWGTGDTAQSLKNLHQWRKKRRRNAERLCESD
jgi:hypothetical protein